VWATTKKIEEIIPNENCWELIEVKTGESDGKKIEITEGLKGFTALLFV
jgi:hypothetical protein